MSLELNFLYEWRHNRREKYLRAFQRTRAFGSHGYGQKL